MIHDFSIQYRIKNNQYPKALQEKVDIMRKLIFKAKNNNDKSKTQKQNKMEVVSNITKMKRVLHIQRNLENELLLWFSNRYVK